MVAIISDGIFNINPDPAADLNINDELVLISTTEAEKEFIKNLS